MGSSDFLGFFAAEPVENEITPAISWPVAEGEDKLRVSQERADFETGCLCEPLPGRSNEEGIAIGRLPNQVCRYCSYRLAIN